MMENPIKMDDLGVPLFLETPKYFWFSCRIHESNPCTATELRSVVDLPAEAGFGQSRNTEAAA